MCYNVSSSTAREQVVEVLKHFNIEVKQQDIFSRCQVCSGAMWVPTCVIMWAVAPPGSRWLKCWNISILKWSNKISSAGVRYVECGGAMFSWKASGPFHKCFTEMQSTGERNVTQISTGAPFWDLGKQCTSRSDAAKCGVWSGSTLFAYDFLSRIR